MLITFRNMRDDVLWKSPIFMLAGISGFPDSVSFLCSCIIVSVSSFFWTSSISVIRMSFFLPCLWGCRKASHQGISRYIFRNTPIVCNLWKAARKYCVKPSGLFLGLAASPSNFARKKPAGDGMSVPAHSKKRSPRTGDNECVKLLLMSLSWGLHLVG